FNEAGTKGVFITALDLLLVLAFFVAVLRQGSRLPVQARRGRGIFLRRRGWRRLRRLRRLRDFGSGGVHLKPSGGLGGGNGLRGSFGFSGSSGLSLRRCGMRRCGRLDILETTASATAPTGPYARIARGASIGPHRTGRYHCGNQKRRRNGQ